MNTADLNTKLIESYISLLKNMSKPNKLELISRLTKTVKSNKEQEKADFYSAFGGWDENESAEDLIENIRGSRTFNRTVEEF
jgi:hypothetical protein